MVANCNVLYQNLKISHKDDETCLRQRGLPGIFLYYCYALPYGSLRSGGNGSLRAQYIENGWR